MEFACSVCEYTSYIKTDVVRHINRKRNCGEGVKEIIEIPIEIICEYCKKNFSTKAHLNDHIKKFCKLKQKALEERIKELERENRKLRNKPTTVNNYGNNNNYGNTYNIMINNYENTSLEKITDAVLNKLIENSNEPHNIIPNLIREVHFNPNAPENHNIYLSNKNKNNKHLHIYKDKRWEIVNKEAEVSNLISDKETHLSDWIGEKGEEYPEAVEKFNDYLDQKYDEDTAKLIREEVELVLYNNRHMVKV
jgi:hypothetical protein